MHIIGVTGGIGAGKSAVLKFLEELPGVRVVEADEVGHRVMEPGTEAWQRLREHFGEAILCGEAGEIDRAALARIVFADAQELAFLNSVIHPAVKDWIRRAIAQEQESGTCRLFVIEAALLIEDHYEELCEEFWYIYAAPEIRRARLKETRGYSEEKIAAIFASQQPDAVFRAHCQAVIDNSGSKEETFAQIRQLLAARGYLVG